MGGWQVREGVWDAGVNRGEKVIGIRQWGAGGLVKVGGMGAVTERKKYLIQQIESR